MLRLSNIVHMARRTGSTTSASLPHAEAMAAASAGPAAGAPSPSTSRDCSVAADGQALIPPQKAHRTTVECRLCSVLLYASEAAAEGVASALASPRKS